MRCCVPFCKNNSNSANVSKGDGITFHELPDDAHLRATWLKALGMQHQIDSALVCSQHFLDDDLCETNSGSRELRMGAVPSTMQVCMICLDTDSKMIPMREHILKDAYEKLIIGYPLYDGGNLKQTLCEQCAQTLRNFSRFRDMSLRARSLMMELVKKHELITIQHKNIIQCARNQLMNHFVSTTVGPDLCDSYVEEESEDGLTDEMETVHEVASRSSRLATYNENEARATEGADATQHSERAPVTNSGTSDNRSRDNDDRIRIKSCSVKLYDILKCRKDISALQAVQKNLSLNVRTAREDGPCRAASEGEVAATFTCDNCQCVFTRRDKIVKHMRTHTGETPYSCKICIYKCIHKSTLVRHMRTHTGEKPFSCKICVYKCTDKGSLVRHMRIHTGEKPYSCEICSYKCTEKNSLVKHMRVHTGEKPYSCKICSYKCSASSTLVDHMRTHTGKKPYSCKICIYTCLRKSTLVDHMRTHTGEKPFCCKICSFKSAIKSTLVNHMRTHTDEKPFCCNICSYKSAMKSTLVNHMRTHTGEKPFCCKICSYKSAIKTTLVNHMRTHTGEKPYSCNICFYKSSRKSSLVNHMRTHTG